MITPTGFDSWSNFFEFGLAREFVSADVEEAIEIPESRLEKFGHVLSFPLLHPVNYLMREIKNPLVILSLTVALVALATLIFYPAQMMAAVYSVLPFLAKVQPWMAKLAAFCVVQTTILGMGLRALGRMCNTDLRKAWDNKEIVAIHIGARIVK